MLIDAVAEGLGVEAGDNTGVELVEFEEVAENSDWKIAVLENSESLNTSIFEKRNDVLQKLKTC